MKDQMIVDAERKIIQKVKASLKGCETKGIVFDKLLSSQTVAELGVVIFNALDFGLKVPLLVFFNRNLFESQISSRSSSLSCLDFDSQEDEERQLSPALENIIDMMTSSGEMMENIPREVKSALNKRK